MWPATFPDLACIVTITDAQTQADPARIICFSYAAQTFEINWVDTTQMHHFHSYQPIFAPVVAWEYLASVCDLNIDGPPANVAETPSEIERAMVQTRQAVLLT